jgi:hypothetical protein
MKHFYEDRASDAADSITRTEEYTKRLAAIISISNNLDGTLTKEQEQLCLEYKGENSELAVMTSTAAYKAGLLDGIAMGITSATHDDEMKSNRTTAFRVGLAEGRAGV